MCGNGKQVGKMLLWARCERPCPCPCAHPGSVCKCYVCVDVTTKKEKEWVVACEFSYLVYGIFSGGIVRRSQEATLMILVSYPAAATCELLSLSPKTNVA